jgi:hypothetical protein
MNALRRQLHAAFDRQHPDFSARIKVGQTFCCGSVLRVALQIDRVAYAEEASRHPRRTVPCRICKALTREWKLSLHDYRIIGYDFPPFKYQFMLVSADHRADLRLADLMVAWSLCRALNYHAFFASLGSGASCPGHIHFHLVSFMPFAKTDPVLKVGDAEMLQNVAGRVTAVRFDVLDDIRRSAFLQYFASMNAQLEYSFNLIIGIPYFYFIPRRCEIPSVWPERLGAIEMGGLFCIRTQRQMAEYSSSPKSFHMRFIEAQREACMPIDRVVSIARHLATSVADGNMTP